MMSHSPHQGRGVVLNDECDECAGRAKTLVGIDDSNLRELASMTPPPYNFNELGSMDIKAAEQLRLMARIVYRSGITEEQAR